MTKPIMDWEIEPFRRMIANPSAAEEELAKLLAPFVARYDEDRERILHLILERDRFQMEAEAKVFVRRELEAVLGTEDIAEAVDLIKRWKHAYDFQVAATAQMEAINASP